MKHNYKIKIDPPMPSDDKIDGHKDFSRILADYRNLTQPIYRKPLYKNPKAFAGLFLILSIAMLVFWTVDQDDQEKEKTISTDSTLVVQLPPQEFPLNYDLQVEFPSYNFEGNSNKPQIRKLDNGITISIPPSTSESSSNAADAINIKIGNNPTDWIAMGYPMATDDNLLIGQNMISVVAQREGNPNYNYLAKEIVVTIPTKSNIIPKLYEFDSKRTMWVEAPNQALELKQVSKNGKPSHDGFGVVEFDANGNPIRRIESNDSISTSGQLILKITKPGTYAIARSSDHPIQFKSAKLNFKESSGNLLAIKSVFALPQGLNSLQVFHAKASDWNFEAKLATDRATVFIAILPGGRSAISSAVQVNNILDGLNSIEMKISPNGIKDLEELKQRLTNL